MIRFTGFLLAFALLGRIGTAGPAVPEPQPADTGRHLVGAIHCPLWNDGSRWQSLTAFPDRKPLLGWYNEGGPEVTDWEIKWALEHGISFFLICCHLDAVREVPPRSKLRRSSGKGGCHWFSQAKIRVSPRRDPSN
jgi:hypothetical protein